MSDRHPTVDEHAEEILADDFVKSCISKCELRPGIGLCDCCGLPKWPQRYEGYGSMVCLDCLDREEQERNALNP